MKASIRGTKIYFDIAGMQLSPQKKDFVEKPVLFLIHGGPGGDHLRYKQHSLELAEAAQLVFIDNRGCGRSEKTKQADYNLDNNIEDIEALRQYLGLNKICVLGTSYGGIVAQGYAIRYPKSIDKLILVATAPSFRFIEEAKKTLNKIGTPKQKAITEHLWQGSFRSAKHVEKYLQLMDSLYSIKTKLHKKPNFAKSKTVFSHEALNEGFGNFLNKFDFIPTLKKIKCPTLVLAGQHDWICSAYQAKVIADRIPHSELKIFKNSSHAISTDAHNEYIKVIKKFLSK